MLKREKQEKQRKSKKSWKKTRKSQTNNWSSSGRKNRLMDFDEDNLPKIRKEKKITQNDWQELLMEEDFDLNDG
ncbi:MAG: hypothetical protein GY865_01755 [candidate division Zixibacteria bacterium]|nr:hypothetical protein [candidate division Zixibacteria bacterium]